MDIYTLKRAFDVVDWCSTKEEALEKIDLEMIRVDKEYWERMEENQKASLETEEHMHSIWNKRWKLYTEDKPDEARDLIQDFTSKL